jgi:DNA-binding NarL/FixJ family response regulator
VTRVVIAYDQALFREGLRAVLTANGVEVVGEARNGAEAVALVAELAPDVVLMDLRMPVLDGAAATRRICAAARPPRVIVLTTFDDDDSVFDAVRAGALGYLLKDTPGSKLVEAIELAARGESWLDPSVAAKLVTEFARTEPVGKRDVAADLGLSERELAVLQRLARGAANKQIAAELHIAEGTVKNHVTTTFAFGQAAIGLGYVTAAQVEECLRIQATMRQMGLEETLGDLLAKIMFEPIPMPSSIVPYLPLDFDGWWARASSRDIEARFQSAKELSDSLAVALGLTAVSTVAANCKACHSVHKPG